MSNRDSDGAQQRGRVGRALSSVRSKQFLIWIVVFTTVYAVAAAILIAVSMPTQYSLLIGLLLAEPLNKVFDWLGEWYRVEQEVSEYNAG